MRHRSRFRFLLFLMALLAPEIPIHEAISVAEAQPAKLLFQSVCVLGTPNEYLAIYNPNSTAVDLTNYYISDAIFPGEVYAYIVDPASRTPTKAGGGTNSDFHVRFPAGAMIASHDTVAVAIQGSAMFETTYGRRPAFEIIASGAGNPDVPNMLEAFPGSIPTGTFGLSNGTESVTIYYWNGETDLVTDVDYVLWGTPPNTNFIVDKTGLSLDGPDADTTPTAYQPDTAPANQLAIAGIDGSNGHAFGNAFRREDYNEGSQRASGGNGVGGRDETSENMESTWSNSNPAAPPFVKGGQPAVLTARPGGPYTGMVNVPVTFNGSGSTPAEGGTITSYVWTFGDGGNGTGVSPTHAYATAGTFTVTLTVTGSAGGTHSATTMATITSNETTLTARPGGPYSGTVGNPITFSGAASTPATGGTITAYDWMFGDGGTGTGVAPTHTYAAAGMFTVTLTVTGSVGGTHSATTMATVTSGGTGGTASKLVFQSVCVQGTPNEYFAIYNPNSTTVDLSNYYVSDAIFPGEVYAYIVDPASRTPAKAGGGTNSDFHVRFPAGSTIASHDTIAVAIQGSAMFETTYSRKPAFEIIASGAGNPDVPNMLEAFPGSIPTGTFGLSNGTESITIYYWNGETDLVTDVDYLLWGTPPNTNFIVDKTGLSLDGPDADTTPTAYKPDTAPANQQAVAGVDASNAHAFGNALRREDYGEGTQKTSGGNGVGGKDETSENMNATWSIDKVAAPPFVKGSAPPPGQLTAVPGGPYTGFVGAAISFDGSRSTPATGQDIAAYEWTFGDGGTGTGQKPSHTYTSAGTFTVSLTVRGSVSGTHTASTTATISAPSEGALQIAARTFIPTLNEIFPVTVDVPSGSEITLRIFDLEGREVKTLFDGVSAGKVTYNWDGRDAQLMLVSAGTLICHLEIRNKSGGVENHQAPIVVARKLERN